MIVAGSIYEFLNDPIRVVRGFNLFFIFILTPLLLFTVVGYFFSWHEISASAMPFMTMLLSVWLGLLVIAYFGCENWKGYGRVASFVAWLPMLFVFPFGTLASVWVIYSTFRKPLHS